MFGRIARRYDRANRVLSFGVDKAWRKRAVRMTNLQPAGRVLDAACGTGDLSFALERAVGPEGTVTGVDFTPRMVELAQAKAIKRGSVATFEEGDVMALRHERDAFDAATISFGIRNVDDPAKGIAELARVVRPGGRVVVLEFGQPKGVWGGMYRTYSKHIMPRIGGLLTGDRAAYEYLPETAARFPAGSDFVEIMADAAPFTEIQAVPLSGKIAWIYAGVVK